MFRYLKIALPAFSAGLISVLISMIAFKEKKVLNAKLIDKNITRVADSLYAYRYETSNWEYNSFLGAIQKTNPDIYLKCLPDTLGWRSILTYCEPMVEYYHRHPGFADYPVVNVSYEGAKEYCNWLTGFYNNDPRRKFKKVVFALPSSEEWMLAAQAGKPNSRYAWGNWSLRNKTGMYMCNCKHVSEIFAVSDSLGKPIMDEDKAGGYYASSGLNDRAFYTAQIQTFYPNSFGIFNMNGNVAEMTNIKTITMGGSWNSYGGEVTNRSMKKYEEISPEVGFRVFMKILE